MIELLTTVLLSGAILYHSFGFGIISMAIISTLTSAFFFIYFLSQKGLLCGLLIGTSLFLGALTVWFHTNIVSQQFFKNRVISGDVVSVDRRLDKTIVVVHDKQFNQLVEVTIHSQVLPLPGDVVHSTGDIRRPEDFITGNGRLFPYHDFLESKNIVAVVPMGNITIISKGNFSIGRFATTLRFRIADLFTRYISFPIDGLMAGMTVGYQGGIPKSIQDLFRTTGVLHVLVLSGENITLVAVFLSTVLQSLPFRLRSFVIGIAILLIVLISGAGVAAVRAGIMGSIALSAGLVRRSYNPLRAVTLSVLYFFFTSPQTLFTDPGFHLSILATIFMIVVMPKAKTLFYWLPEKYNIQELIILAFCIPLFMLPYTMYFSGLVASASPFANVLMVVVTPFIMLCGVTIIAISAVAPIAQLLGMGISWIGFVVIKILEILDTFPQLNTPPLAWWGVLASYVLFFSIIFRKEIKQFWFGLELDM